ncbi:unnamed protein product [Clavelina lepadiformis]|uniref:Endoplasmic reticulum-Golgi intermediate compartment protein 3 n=1 Tax=Clavelina lepadiformis TaxID=159417 RepID=A0ABP0GSW0_CLALP
MSPGWDSFAKKLKKFDAYPKTLEDFRIKTYGDVSGQKQINVDHTLMKQRLNADGSLVDTTAKPMKSLGIAGKNQTEELPADRCESCFGAETEDITCCNTCKDVKEAYRRKGWAFPRDGSIPQCEREPTVMPDINIGEGCMLYGHLEVNKVAGNFHISPGRSYEMGHLHVHDMDGATGKLDINVSHTINHLSFGTSYPGQEHPLDGLTVYADKGANAFQYFTKIVPTTYKSLSGATLRTNQFSVTRHKKVALHTGDTILPGMYLSYELSPMMVRYVEKQRSFMHFLTSACAIVGGVFTVAGILDSFIYHGTTALHRKIELGKLT